MSADDQAFLDILSSLPNDIRRYSGDVADYIDRHVDKIADSVRDSLAGSPWIPQSIRPLPPAPPVLPIIELPISAVERLQNWLWRHKILTGLIVLFSGTVAFRTYRSSRFGRKCRKAKRARSGGRIEVVVVAGSPALPLTRSLALDLERKGYIVFIVCNSVEDEALVHNMARTDVKALGIDIADPPAAGASVERFAQFLQAPHAPVPRAKAHLLELRAVMLIPSLNYQTSPIATIPPSSFADLFNTHLLQPILTIQSFLPLLTTRLPVPNIEKLVRSPKVMVFTPSIISSINPPFHAPEATVCSALSAFTEVLTAELRPLGIPVTHIQLGTFDFVGFTPATGSRASGGTSRSVAAGNYLTAPPGAGHETLTWPEPARHTYGRNFVNESISAMSAGRFRGMRGSSLRELHAAVSDVLDGFNASGVVRVGLGASVYGFVGRWVPRGLVAWMMGIRKVDELATWYPSSTNSPRSAGSARSETGDGLQDFVAVPLETASNVNVWKE